MTIEQVLEVVKRAHEAMGWRPNSMTTREQRNRWFEAAVAAVHYGHPALNPYGSDPNWCIKNAGGGRPQSDDIVVHAPTRAYYDLIGGTGTDGYTWGIGRHSDTLPAEQEVYPPRKASLALFDSLQTSNPQPPEQPEQPRTPPPSNQVPQELIVVLQHIWARLDALDQNVVAALKEAREITATQHRFQDALLNKVATERDFLDRRLKEERDTIVEAINKIDANAKCILRR